MAEEKKTETPKKTSTENKVFGIGVVIIVIMTMMYVPDFTRKGSAMNIDSMSVGALHLTTTYPEIPMLWIDPDVYVTQDPVQDGIAWEKMINGIPVRRFIPGQAPIDLIPRSAIGKMTNMSFRVLEGQTVQTMDLVYVIHDRPTPPRGWREAALKKH